MPPPRERRAPALLAVVVAAHGLLASAGCTSSSLPPPSAPATSESSSQSPEVLNRRAARTWGWVSVAVGAEAAVVAVLTSAMMLHENGVRDSGCDAQKACSPAGLDANARLAQLGGWNAAAWVVTVAGLGAGGVLLWKF